MAAIPHNNATQIFAVLLITNSAYDDLLAAQLLIQLLHSYCGLLSDVRNPTGDGSGLFGVDDVYLRIGRGIVEQSCGGIDGQGGADDDEDVALLHLAGSGIQRPRRTTR